MKGADSVIYTIGFTATDKGGMGSCMGSYDTGRSQQALGYRSPRQFCPIYRLRPVQFYRFIPKWITSLVRILGRFV